MLCRTMDNELKLAFEECSSSLEIFRIRWEGAFDAMAREIKYHRPCWNKYIRDRVPESTKSNTSVPSFNFSTLETSVNTTIIDNNYTEGDHSKILTSTPHVPNDAKFTILQHLILLDISKGVEHAISDNQVLTIRMVIDVYKDRLAEHGINDPREYGAIRKLVKRFLLKNVQSISFETWT